MSEGKKKRDVPLEVMMIHGPLIAARDRNFESFIKNKFALDMVCGFISEGGTLRAFCDMLEMPRGKVSNWLQRDADRAKRYEAAITDGREWIVERMQEELNRIAFSDIRKLWDSNGHLKPPNEWDEEAARLVSGLTVKELFDSEGNKEGETIQVKFHDKLKAMEIIGKKFGLFVNKHEHEVGDKLEDILQKSWEDSVVDVTPEEDEKS